MNRTLLFLLPLLASALVRAEEFDCLIEARQTVEIRSPVEGLVESVKVQRGDLVRKGQIVVMLESGPEQAALEIARARATMTGPVEAAQARVEFAKTKEKRQEELSAQKFVSPSALDEARTERKLAEAELRVALESQKLAELEVQRADALLQLHVIRSPFDGVVVDRMLDPGEFASTNIKEPILKLSEIDPLNVEVVLPAALFGRIRRGDRAEVVPETSTRYTPAQVSIVDRVIDGASGTFGVRLDLRNPDGTIPAGARCRVRFAKK